jgi:hypothetical protein
MLLNWYSFSHFSQHRRVRWCSENRGTCVRLDSIVAHFKEGRSPEQIAHSFPTVTLPRVYGAIAYYLENKTLIEEHFAEAEREFHRRVRPFSSANGLKTHVTVRFLAGEDVDINIVQGLRFRETAIDILDVKSAGLKGSEDPALLTLTAEQARILLVTTGTR